MTEYTADEIASLLAGSTLYHRPVEGSAHGPTLIPMYFAADGHMFAAMGGTVRRARWTVFGGGYQLDWDNGLQGSRSIIERLDGRLVTINPDGRTPRSTIEQIAKGDPENLGMPD